VHARGLLHSEGISARLDGSSAVLSQIFRFLRLVLSAGLHYMERVERPLIWCKKLPNKAVVFYPLDTRLTIHQVYDWEIHAPYFTQSLVLNMSQTFFTPKGTREHEVFSNNCAPKFKILN
jgi:hypothetical protein